MTFRYGDSFQIANELQGYDACSTTRCSATKRCLRAQTGSSGLWEVAARLLERPPKPLPYAAGSWGRDAIDQLVAPYQWHLPYH